MLLVLKLIAWVNENCGCEFFIQYTMVVLLWVKLLAVTRAVQSMDAVVVAKQLTLDDILEKLRLNLDRLGGKGSMSCKSSSSSSSSRKRLENYFP